MSRQTWLRTLLATCLIAAGAASAQVLPPPDPVAPDGFEGSLTQVFQWTARAGATSYVLTLWDVSGGAIPPVEFEVSPSGAGCSSGTGICQYATPQLVDGRYAWSVMARNGAIAGSSSLSRAFHVGPFFDVGFPASCSDSGPGWTNHPAGTDMGWIPDTSFSFEGPCSLKAGSVPVGSKAGIEFTGNFRDGYITFNYKVSSAYSAGCLRFYRDGVQVPESINCGLGPVGVSGDVAWHSMEIAVSAGAHTIRWSYDKDTTDGSPAGFDSAWIDNVQLPLASLPAAPGLVSPGTSTSSRSPTFMWNASPGADFYRFRMYTYHFAADFNVTAAAAGCPSGTGTCSITLSSPFAPLSDNTYQWGVTANTNAGASSPVSRAFFTLDSTGQAPLAVETLAPSGTLTTLTPSYSWSRAQNTTSYQLLVQNTSGVVLNTVVTPETANCVTFPQDCAVTPATALAPGTTYSWFVRAINFAGAGPWSAPRSITTPGSAGPSAPTPLSPAGTIDTTTPSFTWTPISATPIYHLVVDGPNGNVADLSLGGADVNCTTTCSTTLPNPLTPGTTYTWKVRIEGSVIIGPFSPPMTFTVAAGAPTLPPAPATVSPTGTIGTNLPTFSWVGVPAATSYYVLVQNTAGVAIARSVSAAEANCSPVANVCTLDAPAPLMNATSYNWFVNATNANGTGAWSAPRTIIVQLVPPAAPNPYSPTGTWVATPAFQWNPSTTATQYRLVIRNSLGEEAFAITLTPSDAGCARETGNNCSFLLAVNLAPDTYTWMIGAANEAGPGPFATTTFTVQGVIAPFASSPFGTIFTATPEYRWTPVAGAVSYEIVVQNTSGVAFNARYSPAQVNCITLCSVTPSTRLANATYNWFVRVTTPDGTSAWSAPKTFTVSATAPPLAPTLIAPEGTVTSMTPGFQWNASAGATTYFVYITAASGELISNTYFANQVNCPSGTGICLAPPIIVTPGSYTWYVRAANGGGTSEASATKAFTVSAAPPPPSPVVPAGSVTVSTPEYTWFPSPGATSYYLLVQNTAGVAVGRAVTPAEAGCPSASGICRFTPATALTAGATYVWFVNAANSVGTSAWSTGATFTVNVVGPSVPQPPTLRTPSGTTDTLTPRFVWNPSPGAASYELIVQNTAGVAVNVTVRAEVAGCPSGTCSITSPDWLTNGATYNWFVRASNDLGTSVWSAPNTITVSALGPGVPAAPVLMGPSGITTVPIPLFVWMEVGNATGYVIVVQNTAGVVYYDTIGTQTCTASATCAAEPSAPLPPGTYNWFVKAVNAYGASDWSNGLTIRIQ